MIIHSKDMGLALLISDTIERAILLDSFAWDNLHLDALSFLEVSLYIFCCFFTRISNNYFLDQWLGLPLRGCRRRRLHLDKKVRLIK